MSKLLEIFGKGITVNTADIITEWLMQSLSGLDESEVKDALISISDNLANRELIQAENKLKNYLTQTPDCVYARMASTAASLMQNDLNEAINQAQSVYFRQPSNTMALYTIGHCYERLGNIEQALEFYQDCLKFKSFLQLPRQRMAAIYLKQGRLDLARREYEILTSEHPDDIASITLLGYLYLASKQAEQAVDTFNLAILSHPDNFMNVQPDDEIQSLIQNEIYEQAIELIKATIEKVGVNADLIIRMGDAYSQWERDAEAIACYEYASKMEPDSLEAMIKLGTHYLRNQRFSLAAEQFNKACETNDEILDAYTGLAMAYEMSNQSDEALKMLKLAISIQKNSSMLFSEAAILQFQSILDENCNTLDMSDKNIVSVDHVIRVYNEKLKDASNDADAQYKYGILVSGENHLDEAIKALESTIKMNPMNYRARTRLSLCRLENKENQQKVLEILSDNQPVGAISWEKFYQATMIYTDKKAFAKAIRKINTTKSVESIETSIIRTQLENIFETLGIIDRSFTGWERMNELSGYLLKIFETKPAHTECQN